MTIDGTPQEPKKMNDPKRDQLKSALASLVAERQFAAERILSEIEFAEGLCDLHKPQAARWRKLIDQACETVRKPIGSGNFDAFADAIARAERILAPIGEVAKQYTIHCAGHGHIDMNWMWSWPETVAVTNDTFTTVLKLMDEFPDFCYTQSQASVYQIARQYHPELFEQIKQRVAEGRWEVAAVHWVEGDKNIAAGESLARHLLYTRRFFREHMGLSAADIQLDWEPDTFGHAATIPSIVSRGGVTRYYMCRGGAFEKPPVFWWKGPDGRRILVNIETVWYNNHIGPHNAATMLAFCKKTGLKDSLNVYGVGDHGGGPTRKDILYAREMNAWPIYPNFKLNTTRDYYATLEKGGSKLPVFEGELNFEFTGCYTSQALIKQANRYGEAQLIDAEIAGSLAWTALGRDYPEADLREAWINVLFGHFHDILPGSGVAATRHYQRGLYQKAAATASMVKTNSLRAIARHVDTSFAAGETAPVPPSLESIAMGAGVGRGTYDGGLSVAGHIAAGPRPFVVFNPTGSDRDQVITVSIWDAGGEDMRDKVFRVRTPDGKTIPAQRVGHGHYWAHEHVDLALPVRVGPLGYAALAVEEGSAELPKPPVKAHHRTVVNRPDVIGDWAIENEYLLVEFDPVTGGIVKLIDKASKTDLADRDNPLGLLEYVLERPGPMSSWVIHPPQKRICPIELLAFQPVHRGPYVASFEAKAKVNDSTITLTWSLKAGQPWLEAAISAFWLERGGPDIGTPALRFVMPLALDKAKASYEIPFGSIERSLNAGEEVPALRWADVVGSPAGKSGKTAAGCALLNDCKHGHSLDGSTLRLTLIRSSYEPDPLPEIAEHQMRLAVMPHGGKLAASDLVRIGAAFNHPLLPVGADAHDGRFPAATDGVKLQPDNVVLSSIKKADGDDALVVRLFETDGKPAQARIAFDPKLFGKPVKAVQVDFLETADDDSSARVVQGAINVKLAPHAIATLKITFK